MTELYHHGIKGQRWGVRRFQNPDGTRTAAGKERYSEHTAENDNSAGGIGNKEASSFFEEHKKEILIGAGIVAGTLALYGAYKLYRGIPADHFGVDAYATSKPLVSTLQTYRDKSIEVPAGTAFKRISREAMEDYSDTGTAYVSYRLRDTAHYISGSSNKFSFPGGTRDFIHTLTSDKPVKAPSAREMARIYLKQHPSATDQQFRNMITYGFVNWEPEALSDPVISVYKKHARLFKDEVIKQGYGAIIDLEDANNQIASPLILLSLDNFDIGSAQIKSYERVVAKVLKRAS